MTTVGVKVLPGTIYGSYPPRINSRKLKPSSIVHWSSNSCKQLTNRHYSLQTWT